MVAMAIGCAAERSDADLHEPLAAYFEGQGVHAQSLRCDGPLAPSVGSTVACRAHVDGERIEVMMEVVAEAEPPVVRPRTPTLVTARIEPEIARDLHDEGRSVAAVHCEGQLWVIRPGVEHRCEVVQADGRRLSWIGTFTGEGSRHRARIEPRSPAPEAP